MSAFRAQKVVNALPGTLEASTVYFVRIGAGFDVYVTNESGMIVAYPLNAGGGGGATNVDGGNASSIAASNIDGGLATA